MLLRDRLEVRVPGRRKHLMKLALTLGAALYTQAKARKLRRSLDLRTRDHAPVAAADDAAESGSAPHRVTEALDHRYVTRLRRPLRHGLPGLPPPGTDLLLGPSPRVPLLLSHSPDLCPLTPPRGFLPS